jgi:hypothetical protein
MVFVSDLRNDWYRSGLRKFGCDVRRWLEWLPAGLFSLVYLLSTSGA